MIKPFLLFSQEIANKGIRFRNEQRATSSYHSSQREMFIG